MSHGRFSCRFSARGIALPALLLPPLCRAEAFGAPDTSLSLLIGAIVGVPIAFACLLGEAILPRRRVSSRLTVGAAVLALLAVLLIKVALTPPFGPIARFIYLWCLAAPALAVVALRGAVPEIRIRLPAGWLLAFLILALLRTRDPHQNRMVAYGAVAICLTLWSATLLLLHLSGNTPPEPPPRASVAPVPPAVMPGLSHGTAHVLREMREFASRLNPAQAGLLWWLGSSATLYFGIGALIASGLIGMLWFDAGLAQLLDWFGRAEPRVSKPIVIWWLYGLPWSLLVGAFVWALAAGFELFDAGRARVFRFPALVFGFALLAWTAHIAAQVAEVQANEARASGQSR